MSNHRTKLRNADDMATQAVAAGFDEDEMAQVLPVFQAHAGHRQVPFGIAALLASTLDSSGRQQSPADLRKYVPVVVADSDMQRATCAILVEASQPEWSHGSATSAVLGVFLAPQPEVQSPASPARVPANPSAALRP